MTPLGQGDALSSLLFLNRYTEETYRRNETNRNPAEMICTEYGDLL